MSFELFQLVAHTPEILKANQLDLEHSRTVSLSEALRARLKLTAEKMKTLAEGIRQLATAKDPLHKVRIE